MRSDVDLDAPIWGARNIAIAINKPVAATYHLLEKGRIPADKNGKAWVTTLRRLRTIGAGKSAPCTCNQCGRPLG
jgi:hypothetical protein